LYGRRRWWTFSFGCENDDYAKEGQVGDKGKEYEEGEVPRFSDQSPEARRDSALMGRGNIQEIK
jgi:hypothetical protein